MAAPPKEPKNLVHQQAIISETIAKENRYLKLHTNFTINPHNKFGFITGKPNEEEIRGDEDPYFKQVFERAHQEPTKKYKRPQTEAQEYGWISTPLIKTDRHDTRLNHFHHHSSITKFMEKAWLEKEQQSLGN
ncbi:protein FAM183B-like [Pomacea canaliculata]|uniref:protein FAM183B-like n=1 Tax=Pomacea canaliculata TaxID=400727 RepID=UPI000D734E4A|nr:protein FAM183B-like [Pomacea canaliculata]